MIMTVKEREKVLFQHWKEERGYTSFVSDGVFNEEIWNRQRHKITYVLKEANFENRTIDLCDWILSEPKNTLNEWQRTNDGFNFFYYAADRKKPTPIISFYHPQRVAGHKVFQDWYEKMVKIGERFLV